MRAVALVVAAGRGDRLGGGRPKAFVALAGKPMVEWSVEALRAVDRVEQILVALPPGEEAPPGTVGVLGGEVRSDSVRLALAAADPADLVLVHDAARPLATPALFEQVLRALEEDEHCDGAIAAAPVTDTIKEAGPDGRVRSTLDRSMLWAVQTPQAFRHAALERALGADADTLRAATDDAWLIERGGGMVRVVEAPPDNLKVTTPFDLALAERLLGARVDT